MTAGKKIYVGIDPGVSGATAMLDGNELTVFQWEDKTEFLRTVKTILGRARDKQIVAAIEKVGGYVGQKQPGSAMFVFGENFGFQQGVLWANAIPFELVTPQRWQKDMHCGKHDTKMEHKRAMRDHAQRMFPCADITLRAADAVLIAEWAKEFCKL